MAPGSVKVCIPSCVGGEFESAVFWGVFVHPGDVARDDAVLLLNVVSAWRKARSL